MDKQPILYHIGIDGNEANVLQRVGSNVYAYEVICGLHKWQEKRSDVIFTVFLSQPPAKDFPAESETWRYKIIPHVPFWIVWRFGLELRTRAFSPQLDLIFSPGHYTPVFSPIPVVASIMDLAYEHFPKQFKAKDYWQLKLLTQYSAKKAVHLFAISEATRDDLIKTYGVNAERISVAPPAVKNVKKVSDAEVSDVLKKWGITQPYVLYVGTLQPRKNIKRLVAALERLHAEGIKPQLVLAGRVGWLSESVLERVRSSVISPMIRQLGFVTDTEKTALIQGAKVLALLGLYEGFGIPPLEAIQLGTVPVVSNTASLPEVVGKHGFLADPSSTDDIVKALKQALLLSAAEKQERLKQMNEHIQKFSWDTTADHIGEVLVREAASARRAQNKRKK